ARARRVRLAPRCRAMVPRLRRQWAATSAAADRLDAELSSSLRALITEAVAALEQEPFLERIRRIQKRRRS
ncbi:MAG: MarR family transcriptional regulator, partial [Gaiellaceae bacterium]